MRRVDADRGRRRWRRFAVALLVGGCSSWVLSGVALAQLVGSSQSETRALAISFDSLTFTAGKTFTWELVSIAADTDTCRVEMQGGYDSGWLACPTISGSHSFTYAGIRWVKMRARDVTANPRLVRIITLAVEPVTPTPTPTPAPTHLVEIVNKPRVEVANTPLPVKWRGCYEVDATCPTGGGLSPQDSENVEMLHDDVRAVRWNTLVASGFALFALAGLLVFAVRGLFR